MRKKILIIFSLVSVFSMVLTHFATSKPNYDYRIYTPQNLSTLTDKITSSQKSSEILFIVDYSNSMNDTIGSKTKLDMARNTLAEIIPKIPPSTKVGLRIYGHKAGFTYLQGCQATNLVVPIAANNFESIMQALYSKSATGWTPITYSLKQAINSDLAGVSGKKHIILLTDGGENCDESPCTYVINLLKTRDDIMIDVIAFDIRDDEANNQLRCTALMTRGKFLQANNEADLYNSLFESVGISKDVKANIRIPQE